MGWIGEMLVKGLAGSIEDNGDEAVKAAEAMSEDINDVMSVLAEDMGTALPTNFSVDTSTVGTTTSNTISAQIGSENLKKGTNGQVGIEVVFEYEDGTTETRFIDLF